MNSKFIRILIIINGILIPIFILYIFGSIVYEKIEKDEPIDLCNLQMENQNSSKFSIQNSEPIQIPNSEFYYVTVEKKYQRQYGEIDIDIKNSPNMVRQNTINVLFLNKQQSEIGKLLPENGSITSMSVLNRFTENHEEIKQIKNIAYYIATKDTNEDGIIDSADQHYVYLSDLNGKNLKKVTDRKVKKFQWLNQGKEMILTLYKKDDDTDFDYAIYNLETKETRPTEKLNEIE
ncbi:hypothetical protein [uncultured Formosa sp.]|uniref:hypothetical protein n=1 Tax=uncultured Formosa sp. TaxID=255435 RepID=UPI00263149E2|nr:hypothetical protein [uncultured Formosa sp.]